MPKSGLLFEKKGNASNQILQLFERVRVAYLSARTDPKEYGSKWRSAIEYIKEEYDDSGKFGEEEDNEVLRMPGVSEKNQIESFDQKTQDLGQMH